MNRISTDAETQAFVRICYAAMRPFIFVGRHGVGKSEKVQACAAALDVKCVVLDLSLMEPTDLTGLPHSAGGMTVFHPPAVLPRNGRGLLILEELNRAPRATRAPCFQLLTARRLNEYVLPPGWLACASINEAEDGYDVDDVDEALRSRFVQVRIEPDVNDWCAWALHNDVDSGVVAFVRETHGVFTATGGNPRSFTYASQLVKAWRTDERREPRHLLTLLSGVLGDVWGAALWSALTNEEAPLLAEEIIASYQQHQGKMRRWFESRRVDVIRQSWENLYRALQSQQRYDEIVDERGSALRNIEAFLADLVPDLLDEARDWLRNRGYEAITLPEPRVRRSRGRRTP